MTLWDWIKSFFSKLFSPKDPVISPPVVVDPPKPEPAKFNEPEFVVVKGVRFKDLGAYKTPSGNFSGLVVHYTVSGRTESSARGVVGWLRDKGYGCMVMDEAGKIYIPEGFDVMRSWGYHAGTSKWGDRSSVSDVFAGMEMCCWGLGSNIGPYRESKGEANIIPGKYQAYTEAQEKALTNFILWARSKNPEFKLENVVGHDELRTAAGQRGGKTDPGASLSMTMPAYREYLEKLAGGAVVTPPKPPTTGGPLVQLSWHNAQPEAPIWSAELFKLVRDRLPTFDSAQDWDRIYPGYRSLLNDQRATVVCEMISAIAKFECDWEPWKYNVDAGKPELPGTWSVGLMQVSVDDQEWCGGNLSYTFRDLQNGIPNLTLAVQLLVYQLNHTGLIILKDGQKYEYWSTMLDGNPENHIDEIIAMVRKVKF